MDKRLLAFVILLVLCGLSTVPALGQVQTPSRVQTGSQTVSPVIVEFYAEVCPDCARMEEVLDALLVDRPEIKVARYEINSPGASALLWKLSAHYKILATRVPVIFVGDQAIVGAGRAQEFALRTAIGDCVTLGCPSPLDYAKSAGLGQDLLWLGLFVGAVVLFLLMQR